jgi:predicted transcriptional regulator
MEDISVSIYRCYMDKNDFIYVYFQYDKKTKNIMAYVYDAYIRLKGIMKSHNVDKDDVKDKINEVLDKYKKFEKLSFSEFMAVIEILITPTNGIRS